MGRIFSDRKIHLIATMLLLVFYISLGVLIYGWIKSHSNEKGTKDQIAMLQSIIVGAAFIVAISGTMVLLTGIYYLSKINDSSQYYRTLNKVTGVLLIVGGLGVGIFLTTYLIFNE